MRVRSKDEDRFVQLLRSCAKKKDLLSGIKIHVDILKRGLLGKNHSVARSLIRMYANCGDFAKAWELHDELPVRDIVSWSLLIGGYAEHGRVHEAMNCFEQMQIEGFSPDAIIFTCILKACSVTRSIEKGKRIHDMIVDRGLLDKDIVLGNALLDMYAKCGMLEKAKQVSEGLPSRDVVSWNSLISGFAQHNQGHEALGCFKQMQKEGVAPDAITFACILKACGSMRDIEKGKGVHDEIVNMGLLDGNAVLGNALIDMYVKCGVLEKAYQVLEVIPLRDVASWSILIAGYVEQGKIHEVLGCFEWMRNEGIPPDVVILTSILKACGSLGDVSKGIQIHEEIVRREFMKKNLMLLNALVDMYVKCGALEKAQKVHDELLVRNVCSWNALIAGYAQRNDVHEAFNCSQKMQCEGLSPDRNTYISILKACGNTRSIEKGEQIHYEIVNRGFFMGNDVVLKNAIVDMYAKCGVLSKAQQLLDQLPNRNVVTWNSLISGYVQEEQYHEALICFDRMQREGIAPDVVTLSYILNACGGKKDIEKGEQVHKEIVNRSLLYKNIVLGTALIDMYVKCGHLVKAHLVLDEISVRDIVSWSVLIAGYTLHGQGHDAINCFESMQIEGLCPDVITFIAVLKACGSIGIVEKGEKIHDDIVRRSLLDKHSSLGIALIDMYGKCGAITKAQLVHDELQVQNVSSWNALISGYVEQKQGHEALHCFDQMLAKGFSPDLITYLSALKACGVARAIDKGKQIHNEIIRRHMLKENIVLSSTLVDMYSKCGMMVKAHEVLEELPVRNVVSWNALISGYAQEGQGHEALNCYELMEIEGLTPDVVTFLCILKACGNAGNIGKGKQIHDEIVNKGLLEKNSILGNALVDMYAKCGELEKAQTLHDVLPSQSISSWNALITGYIQYGQYHLAMNCYEEMQNRGLSPDAVTFTCILNACGQLGNPDRGKQIHDQIVSSGLLEENVMLSTAVVDMYAKCGLLVKAKTVHSELHVRNIASWNALITGYAQKGHYEDAIKCLEQMQIEGHSPDAITFTCILRACSNTGAIEKGKQIHEEIVRQDILKGNCVLGTALVDMYSKCGMLAKAQKVLEELSLRDVVCWSALVSGYAQQGQGQEALSCFDGMQSEGLSPNEVTLSCFLKACGSIGAIEKGEQLHAEIADRGLLEKNVVLATALVDMYAKCGALSKADKVHNELPIRTVESWNALIAGYAQQGQSQGALKCLVQMQGEGLGPNEITFVSLLGACSHSSKLDEAETFFGDMGQKYGIAPCFEHHTSMVVVLGSAGKFDMAVSVIKTMPCAGYSTVWLALLSACKRWGNVELGRLVFNQVVELDDNHAAAYVFMADIYAAAGMSDDAEKVKAMVKRKKNGMLNILQGRADH